MNYTKSTRHDGCWDAEQECLSDDEHDPEYGPLEVFKLRRNPGPGHNTRRPICQIESPDFDGDKSECAGNIALIINSPRMYASLQRAAETLRFLVNREDMRPPGLQSEVIQAMGDAEATLRQVERVAEQLLAGEHVS